MMNKKNIFLISDDNDPIGILIKDVIVEWEQNYPNDLKLQTANSSNFQLLKIVTADLIICVGDEFSFDKNGAEKLRKSYTPITAPIVSIADNEGLQNCPVFNFISKILYLGTIFKKITKDEDKTAQTVELSGLEYFSRLLLFLRRHDLLSDDENFNLVWKQLNSGVI